MTDISARPGWPTLEQLGELPAAERVDVLSVVLETEFRAALLMTEDDELPFDQSFFDLGLTSLSLTDLKQRIEEALLCEIDTNVLFSSPTIERLLAHLCER